VNGIPVSDGPTDTTGYVLCQNVCSFRERLHTISSTNLDNIIKRVFDIERKIFKSDRGFVQSSPSELESYRRD
jgi:hypothetical protein